MKYKTKTMLLFTAKPVGSKTESGWVAGYACKDRETGFISQVFKKAVEK
ncbi:MAG: hypothetical protein LBI13_11205 [Streptococcaceae bacterium]|jgi:hypothetical protein|nr:hypothetical protein [Streptococcaceae bacterium]